MRSAPPCPAPRGSGADPRYLPNLLAKVPKSAQPWLATMVRTIFDQPDAAAVPAQVALSLAHGPGVSLFPRCVEYALTASREAA